MRKALRPPAALAMLVVIVAGCSSGSRDTGGTSTTTSAGTGTSIVTTHGQAVKFAECMRANGVSAFPDPDASGELTIDAVANNSTVDTSSATFARALSACRNLQPSGFTGSKVSPKKQQVRLQFAQCMRDNGIKDFPDPTANGPLIDTSRMPGSPGALSIPGFKAATEKCRDFPAAAGVTRGP
jgi:hypothetical protein